jgi:hypothetical protein
MIEELDGKADIWRRIEIPRCSGLLKSAAGRLKKLNEIPRRVYQQDLRSAGSRHDVVSELRAGGTQPRHLRGKIVDDQVNAIPAAWPRPSAVGHRSSGRAFRPAEQQP